MEEKLRQAVSEALAKAGAPGLSFVVERPAEISHGDYATNAALVGAKQLGRNPRELADELAGSLIETLGTVVSHVAVAGPGFVNITLAREAVTLAVAEADAQGEAWGKGSLGAGQRVMVEYTDPNPFKPMHIGHLMSNIIGEALSRLIANDGAAVIRANYGGDIGPHVAKAIWALRKEGNAEPMSANEIGQAYVAGSRAYESDASAKIEIDALNAAIYEGTDQELMDLWQRGRAVSLEAFGKIYAHLGSKFDYFFFESETAEPGSRVVRDGLAKGIFEESEGAVIYKGEKKGLHTLVFITSRGTPTYEAKDIGLAFLKEERVATDRSIIMTGTEQIGHFKVVLAALSDIAPLIAAKTTHVPHGLLRLTTGKMSSREGKVITAEEFIAEIIAKASEKNADALVAEQVAIGAIKYMVLRQSPGSDIIFDPEKSLSLEGDSGPYLQYALVRAKSVLEKAEESAKTASSSPEQPYPLERMIVHYPEVVARAARELAPNLLTNYLTELAGEWNSFYAQERIVGGEHESHKLLLARAFVNTMKNGLAVLGIPVPDKM